MRFIPRQLPLVLLLAPWLVPGVFVLAGDDGGRPLESPRVFHSDSGDSRVSHRAIRFAVNDLQPQAEEVFPRLPPDPDEGKYPPLPPLEEELWLHGGSYLYAPEGDRLNWPGDPAAHFQYLRLPEDWQEPRPATLFTDFLGAGPIRVWPRLHWPGADGYSWEPRFVAYGGYSLFAFSMEQNRQRRDALGHQLVVDLDLRLTGTERFHVEYRPLGRDNTGGSYYQFSDPEGYVNNATGTPARYWFEAELHSLFGAFVDPFAVLDYHIVAGKFPFAMHNALLMNDEILGVAVNKNNIYLGQLSNLNVQLLYAFNDVDTYPDAETQVIAVNISADRRRTFYELTYAFVADRTESNRDAHYAAVSQTRFCGPLTVAARALLKWGDGGGTGSGQLLVLETNYTRVFDSRPGGIEHGVFYANLFGATDGWNSIGGGNFNRLVTAFEVNPLAQIAAGFPTDNTWGAAAGVQLFRRNEDESLIPEFAFSQPDGDWVWGLGLRYLRKTGPRTFVEVLGVWNESANPQLDREGVFAAYTIVF